jgi:hypothetical protein
MEEREKRGGGGREERERGERRGGGERERE